MASNVSELKTVHTDAPKEQKVGLTMELQFAISEGQTLQFSTFAGRDDSAEELNSVLDKITAAGERQKNKASLAKCHQSLVIQNREIELAQQQMTEAERRHAAEKVERDERARELQIFINTVYERDAESFAIEGKRGAYKPSVAANEKTKEARTLLARIEPEQAAQDQVKIDAVKRAADTILSYESNIEWINREIARYEAALAE